MKRFALITTMTAAALIGSAALADADRDGGQDAPGVCNQSGHWEYRTFIIPIIGTDDSGNETIIDYRYETRRVWVHH